MQAELQDAQNGVIHSIPCTMLNMDGTSSGWRTYLSPSPTAAPIILKETLHVPESFRKILDFEFSGSAELSSAHLGFFRLFLGCPHRSKKLSSPTSTLKNETHKKRFSDPLHRTKSLPDFMRKHPTNHTKMFTPSPKLQNQSFETAQKKEQYGGQKLRKNASRPPRQ